MFSPRFHWLSWCLITIEMADGIWRILLNFKFFKATAYKIGSRLICVVWLVMWYYSRHLGTSVWNLGLHIDDLLQGTHNFTVYAQQLCMSWNCLVWSFWKCHIVVIILREAILCIKIAIHENIAVHQWYPPTLEQLWHISLQYFSLPYTTNLN